MKDKLFTVDRRENGKWILEDEKGNAFSFDGEIKGAREGDKVLFDGNGFKLCAELSEKEREIMKMRQSALFERSKRMDNYKFFCHKECEYFPCHKTDDPDNFNCLFCYCPLYALGDGCGGNFTYTEKGFKDCTNCLVPHRRENYEYITKSVLKLYEKIKNEGKK